jgi:hypothetical protein
LSTIEMNLGRGQGHTSYIATHAVEGDIIIVPNHNQVKLLKQRYPGINKILILTTNNLRGVKINRNIWFDDWSRLRVDPHQIEVMLHTLVLTESQYIFKMG